MTIAREKIVLIGAGGHARMLIDALRTDPTFDVHAIVDSDPRKWGNEVLGVPVVGGDEQLPTMRDAGVSKFAVAIGAVGQSVVRRRIFETAIQAGLAACRIFHSTAIVSEHAHCGDGTQILINAVVNTNARLGDNVLVNTAAIVEHDCIVEAHTHIAPRASLAGGVRVGWGSHIGLGAVIRENIAIGDQAIVGAGAVVVEDVPARTVVVGVPAGPLANQEITTRNVA